MRNSIWFLLFTCVCSISTSWNPRSIYGRRMKKEERRRKGGGKEERRGKKQEENIFNGLKNKIKRKILWDYDTQTHTKSSRYSSLKEIGLNLWNASGMEKNKITHGLLCHHWLHATATTKRVNETLSSHWNQINLCVHYRFQWDRIALTIGFCHPKWNKGMDHWKT